MEPTLCPCGQIVPEKQILLSLTASRNKKALLQCTACASLLFAKVIVSHGDKQMLLFNLPPGSDELNKARDYVESGLDRGVDCPCCEQHCVLVQHTLTADLVDVLRELVNGAYPVEKGWVDTHKQGAPSPTFYRTLRFWGLTKERSDPRTGERSGCWKATPLGVSFINNEAEVHEIVYTYNSRPRRFGGQVLTVGGYE